MATALGIGRSKPVHSTRTFIGASSITPGTANVERDLATAKECRCIDSSLRSCSLPMSNTEKGPTAHANYCNESFVIFLVSLFFLVMYFFQYAFARQSYSISSSLPTQDVPGAPLAIHDNLTCNLACNGNILKVSKTNANTPFSCTVS